MHLRYEKYYISVKRKQEKLYKIMEEEKCLTKKD